MAVYRDIKNVKFKQTAVTVGSFDGVHCGHQFLVRRTIGIAARLCCRSIALTFWPHPRVVLNPASSEEHLLLNTLDEKIALLEQTGIDDVIVYPFDKDLSQTSAESFINNIIIGKLNARRLVVGQDHHFGMGRSGNVQLLPEITANSSLKTEIIELKTFDAKISSSAIRKALTSGDLSLANRMLGYEYAISGKVISGNQLGRTIGFPTANIEMPTCKLIPADGVYRATVHIGVGQPDHTGMAYIGTRPVLQQKNSKTHVEVHIFDFDRQIYDQNITLTLTHRIRGDMNFESLEQLADQLRIDRQAIRSI